MHRILFAGTPEFATCTLGMLVDSGYPVCAVYTQPDRAAGRGRQLQASPVKQLALRHEIPVLQPESLKPAEQIAALEAFDADLLIVVAYGMILPQRVLDIPKRGCVNVHASLLPRWRGAAPIQRAVMAGDSQTGVTIMQMEAGLDTGPMLHQKACEIAPSESASEVHDRLAKLGAQALEEVLPAILDGNQEARIQDKSQVTYAEKLSKSEAILDWRESALNLQRKVLGLNSWPVAQTRFQGQTLRVWRAQALEGSIDLPPGRILDHSRDFDVATGEGILRVLEIQLPGGKRMPAEAFLNAHKVACEQLG